MKDNISFKCGAHAMQAVLDHYSIAKSIDDIWSEIATKRPNGIQYYATTDKVTRYSNMCGVPATIYKSADILKTLDMLDEIHKTAILVVAHKRPGNPNGHFIVYKGKKDGNYVFADPEMQKNRTMAPLQTREYCKETGDEVRGNIFITFGDVCAIKHCEFCNHEYPLVNANELRDSIDGALCCYCNKGKHNNVE